jgi:hypothetical protein
VETERLIVGDWPIRRSTAIEFIQPKTTALSHMTPVSRSPAGRQDFAAVTNDEIEMVLHRG